jgi:hypothetical protein
MTDEIRLMYLGGATIRQGDRRFDANVTLFGEGATPVSFFGHYEHAPEGLERGTALIRFPDATEADAVLAVVDEERGGFRLTSGFRDLQRT